MYINKNMHRMNSQSKFMVQKLQIEGGRRDVPLGGDMGKPMADSC